MVSKIVLLIKLNKFFSYPISVIYFLFFALTLLFFHPIQWLCLNVFGYRAHKKSVDILNWCLLRCLNILGATAKIEMNTQLMGDHPVVIVSNHQSMWDIPPIIYYLRKYHPKFISKKELGKGIPSISYNLKHGGSVLIDRNDKDQSLLEIKKFTHYLNRFKRGGVIFPEGTRSKKGITKSFKRNGLRTLLEHLREGYVIPVSINNTWKLQRWGMFPIQFGVRYELISHPAIKISDFDIETLIDKVEKIINSRIK